MRRLLYFPCIAIFMLAFVACNGDDEPYDSRYDWKNRNASWFLQVADSARTAIRQAQVAHGDEWEEYCDWRMYKSLSKASDYDSGILTDSICVRIISRGSGKVSPIFTDTVRCNYRAWLMPTIDAAGEVEETVFDQTYYGPYDVGTALPTKLGMSNLVPGFSTALQHMVVGDDWMIYIPQELAYGEKQGTSVPAYSTLRFRTQLMGIYPKLTLVPDWK